MLLLTSPRSLSVCFINELGNVIPTFSVLSLYVVRIIRILYLLSHSYKSIDQCRCLVHIDAHVSTLVTLPLLTLSNAAHHKGVFNRSG